MIIKGSSRKNGNTQQVVASFLTTISAALIDLQDYNISYYDYEHKNQSDDFLRIAEQMVQYEVIIFATPVYWYSMSAIMKTYFDRLSDLLTIRKDLGRALAGKSMYVIACSSDAMVHKGFFLPFQQTAQYLNMRWKGGFYTWIEAGQVKGIFRNF